VEFIQKLYHEKKKSLAVAFSLIDWLIIVLRPAQEFFHLHVYRDVTIASEGDVTIACEGLQNLGLCTALRAFEQGGIFIVTHLLRHGASVFLVSSEGPPHSVAFYDTQGDVKDLFLPGSSRVPSIQHFDILTFYLSTTINFIPVSI
jgi:hypothetical protein